MQKMLLIACMCYATTCFGQFKIPDRIYLWRVEKYGCETQILKLYPDSSFSLYTNLDQLDCLSEEIQRGAFIRNDSIIRFYYHSNSDRATAFEESFYRNAGFKFYDSTLISVEQWTDTIWPAPIPKIFRRINFTDLSAFRIVIEDYDWHRYWKTSYQLFPDHSLFYLRKQDSCGFKTSEQAWILLDDASYKSFTTTLSAYDFYQADHSHGFMFANVELRFSTFNLVMECTNLAIGITNYLASLCKPAEP